MDLLTLVRVLLRRWYVVVPVMLLGALAAGATYASISPSYQTTGSVLLLNPPAGVDPDTGKANPYVGNLGVAARVVTVVLESPPRRRELYQQGNTGVYTFAVDPASPIINVMTTAPTADDAKATTTAVMESIDSVLADRQEQLGAPKSIYVTTQVVTSPTDAVPLNGSRIRAALALMALGAALTVGSAFAVEGVIRQRARRRDPETQDESSPADEQAVSCPFCDEVMWDDELVDHLGAVHGLLSDQDDAPSSTVYPLPRNRETRFRGEEDPGTESRRSSPQG